LCVISTGDLSKVAHGNETGFGGDREAAAAGSAAVKAWGQAGRGCQATRCVAANGQSLGFAARCGQGRGRQAQGKRARTATAIDQGAVHEPAGDFIDRCAASGISDGAVDDQAGAGGYPGAVRRPVFDRRMLAAAARVGFYAAKTGKACDAAQRGSHRAVEAQELAGAKKKALREGRTIVFIDESGLSEKCPVTRTWALRGHTPIIQQSFDWKQVSAIAGLSWWRFYFRFFPGAIKSEQLIEFLAALHKQIGKKLLIVWDGVRTHRSRLVHAWLERQDGQIAIAFLPPYAPELNPVEAIWAYLKKNEIANLCPTTIAQVSDFARRRLKSMQRRSTLIRAFWQQAELAL